MKKNRLATMHAGIMELSGIQVKEKAWYKHVGKAYKLKNIFYLIRLTVYKDGTFLDIHLN